MGISNKSLVNKAITVIQVRFMQINDHIDFVKKYLISSLIMPDSENGIAVKCNPLVITCWDYRIKLYS